MNSLRIMVVGCCAALLLGACSGMELEKAERMSAGGTQFDKDLYTGYIGLAKDEYAEGDYEDSDNFATRAALSASGKPTVPEEIGMRKLPNDKVGELTDARSRLMAALAAGAREKAPKEAASAQVMFDCWMQEQEENFQPEDIARCRGGFMAAMGSVEASLKPMPVATRAPTAEMPTKKTFVVYFPLNSAKITPQSKEVILSAIDAAKELGAKQIAVYGHTDTAGAQRYNASLSSKRSEAVAKALTDGGIKSNELNLGAFGETLPAVDTGDDVKLPQNRRVVIEVTK